MNMLLFCTRLARLQQHGARPRVVALHGRELRAKVAVGEVGFLGVTCGQLHGRRGQPVGRRVVVVARRLLNRMAMAY